MKNKNIIRMLRMQNFPENIVGAFEKVDRKLFVPKKYQKNVEENMPLPIGYEQTTSQPYTIAFMLMLLEIKENDNILEIGSGSGYVLAILSELTKGKIIGLERIKQLAKRSKNTLINYPNVDIFNYDGTKGFPGIAHFNKILVSASSDSIPKNLVQQLKIGGILVAPVKNSIVSVEKFTDGVKIKEYQGFYFVPLIEGKDKD